MSRSNNLLVLLLGISLCLSVGSARLVHSENTNIQHEEVTYRHAEDLISSDLEALQNKVFLIQKSIKQAE